MIAEETQRTKVATSNDGIAFSAGPETLGNSYFRVFEWENYYYAIGMPGVFYRSKDGLRNFEQGPTLFSDNMRHCALKLDGVILNVFYTNVFDSPERIYLSKIDLKPDWFDWKESKPGILLEPDLEYEGGCIATKAICQGSYYEQGKTTTRSRDIPRGTQNVSAVFCSRRAGNSHSGTTGKLDSLSHRTKLGMTFYLMCNLVLSENSWT